MLLVLGRHHRRPKLSREQHIPASMIMMRGNWIVIKPPDKMSSSKDYFVIPITIHDDQDQDQGHDDNDNDDDEEES